MSQPLDYGRPQRVVRRWTIVGVILVIALVLSLAVQFASSGSDYHDFLDLDLHIWHGLYEPHVELRGRATRESLFFQLDVGGYQYNDATSAAAGHYSTYRVLSQMGQPLRFVSRPRRVFDFWENDLPWRQKAFGIVSYREYSDGYFGLGAPYEHWYSVAFRVTALSTFILVTLLAVLAIYTRGGLRRFLAKKWQHNHF